MCSGKLPPLKKFTLHPGEGRRFALAIFAGLLLAAAFPKPGVKALAWLAPGLLLAAALGAGGGAAFRLGYAAGLAHCLASLHWLLFIPVSFAPIAGWLALSAFLALYPAVWVWLCWKIYPARIEPGPGSLASLEDFLAAGWWSRLAWMLACAALWVTWEMIQARLFSGFPWNFLGASQYQMLPLIQIVSVTGVYGVSFLVCWFSLALWCAVAVILREPEKRTRQLAELAVPLLVVAGVIQFGIRRVSQTTPDAARPALKLALVQPSIPQTWIWDPNESSRRFQQLIELSRDALTNRPDLLVWPEAAVPNMVRFDEETYVAVTNLARTHQSWLVLGSDDAAVRDTEDGQRETNYFNSSFLVRPDGELAATYRKRRLVIFGEYVPLLRWLPFLKWFTPIQGGFTAGERPVTFELGGLQVKCSTLICFEDVFPHTVREHVEEDTDFLLNLTNDGWFGESAAQWQHLANAAFRAVENGLPLVRCANNGVTCWVDAQGRVSEAGFPGSGDVYGAGFKLARVPLLAGEPRPPTFYRRHGDRFGWACVAVAALAVLRLALRRSNLPNTKAEP